MADHPGTHHGRKKKAEDDKPKKRGIIDRLFNIHGSLNEKAAKKSRRGVRTKRSPKLEAVAQGVSKRTDMEESKLRTDRRKKTVEEKKIERRNRQDAVNRMK